jgi:hypothetical protein
MKRGYYFSATLHAQPSTFTASQRKKAPTIAPTTRTIPAVRAVWRVFAALTKTGGPVPVAAVLFEVVTTTVTFLVRECAVDVVGAPVIIDVAVVVVPAGGVINGG